MAITTSTTIHAIPPSTANLTNTASEPSKNPTPPSPNLQTPPNHHQPTTPLPDTWEERRRLWKKKKHALQRQTYRKSAKATLGLLGPSSEDLRVAGVEVRDFAAGAEAEDEDAAKDEEKDRNKDKAKDKDKVRLGMKRRWGKMAGGGGKIRRYLGRTRDGESPGGGKVGNVEGEEGGGSRRAGKRVKVDDDGVGGVRG
ncbi:hypothetical protein VTJ49DRAFT_2724 [Mycothermus thermophilus]|uniref:Uncharacterized protein n=1 Tax=Humicola insolens TaxID=85995 RepID=A0ABR3VMQ3_HUMIN